MKIDAQRVSFSSPVDTTGLRLYLEVAAAIPVSIAFFGQLHLENRACGSGWSNPEHCSAEGAVL
jgi:hypothetical protein